MKLEDGVNDQLMATAAHRYCLGRQSYIVDACLTWLKDTWDQFDENTRRVMVRDTIEALMDGYTGGEIDTIGWKNFATWSFKRLLPEDQLWIINSTTHKNKLWPI